MKRMMITLTAILLSYCALAQVPPMDESVFLDYTRKLKEEGNRYYRLGHKSGIKRTIELYRSALDDRWREGQLSKYSYDSLNNEICRLEGDYHYENADVDPSSFAKAEKCFLKCLDYSSTHTTDRTAYRDQYIVLMELAQLYYKEERYLEALEKMTLAYKRAGNYHSPGDDEFLDVTGQLAICLARNGFTEDALEYIDDVVDNYRDRNSERYGEALRRKANILMLDPEVSKENVDIAVSCYREYFQLKRSDALESFSGMSSSEREEYWASTRPFVTDCYTVEGADPKLLYDVALFSKALLLQLDSRGAGKASLTSSWKDIQASLGTKSCAVEFIQYKKAGKQRMAALIVRKKGNPEFVGMPDPDVVYSYSVYGRPVSFMIRSVSGKAKNPMYSDSTGLFRMIWNDSLLKALGDAKDVYFSPDGYLHQLAIEYMIPEEAGDIRAHRLTTTRMLLSPSRTTSFDRGLFVGGLDYNSDCCSSNGENDASACGYIRRRRCRFDKLAYSSEEIDSLVSIWNSPATIKLKGTDADEANFRASCQNADFLHISTHGLFGAASQSFGTDLKPCVSDTTLSQSVIVLSGGQYSIDSNNSYDSSFDGLLSAKELSSMDLSDAGLVVLACCETGLGYLTSDGVYGIQRGLKNAGAGAMVVSLWDVNDKATSLFMTAFHRGLKQGTPVREAFDSAREAFSCSGGNDYKMIFNSATLVNEYESSLNFYEPQYRDAFVLIDAIQ